MIRSYMTGEQKEESSLLSALGLAQLSAPIISVVGAGGKTTVVKRIAREYEETGQPVIVTTTTHMLQPKEGYYLMRPDIEQFAQMIKKNRAVWLGTPEDNGKMSAFPMAFLEAVRILGIPMVIEADGARGLPLKVPAAHEPVLWGKTMALVGVAGLDSIGGRIRDVSHRPEETAKLLGKTVNEELTCVDIVTIGLSSRGMKKNMDPYMRYSIVLNKADNKERIRLGENVAELFAKEGFQNVILASGLGEGR